MTTPDELDAAVKRVNALPKSPSTGDMLTSGEKSGAAWLFKGTIRCRNSGHYGYTVRVLPRNANLGNPYEPGLVCWG